MGEAAQAAICDGRVKQAAAPAMEWAGGWRATAADAAQDPTFLAGYAVVTGVYFLSSLVFTVLDAMHERRGTLGAARFQGPAGLKAGTGLDWALYRRAWGVAVWNYAFVSLPLGFAFSVLRAASPGRGWPAWGASVPGPLTWAVHLAAFVLVEEVCFFHVHRAMHSGLLYGRLHKLHHTWTQPVAVSAVYCTSFEMAFQNVIPVLLGPHLMRSHPAVTLAWATFVVLNTTVVHSGYAALSDGRHDLHHQRSDCNFGVLGLFDRIHGTGRSQPRARRPHPA